MIYRLEIENFFSIKERQTIDLTVGSKVPAEPGRLVEIHDKAEERAPRVVAIFGPNASGKSNLLRALSFLAWFVRFSFQHDPIKGLPYQKFGSRSMIGKPTRLSVSFSGAESLTDPESSLTCPYTYTLELSSRQDGSDRVLHEAIYFRPSGTSRFRRVIERNSKGEVKGAPEMGLGRERAVLETILRSDASVLPTLAQLNNKVAISFVQSAAAIFTNILMTRFESDTNTLLRQYAEDENLLKALNSDIRRIDLGVEEVNIIARNGAPIAVFNHSGLEQPIELPLESHGTQQFVKIFPILYDTLSTGGIAIIDELDAAIHPTILPEILRWFSDEKRNPHGAQLWTSCHSASLLDDLLKEEVLFCEKNELGATEFYRLGDIQGIRRTENFRQNYLGGIYGALPRVG